MLKVYHSNSLDVLRDLLVEMICLDPLSDPFRPEQILVQSPGMAQWLKLELAQRIGISANVEFPLPASFLWRTFSELLTDVPERSAYSKESMTWILMRILPEQLLDDHYQALALYMDDDQTALRLYHLCGKIADLFDQYLVYRPDWIAQWEGGENAPAVDDQLWQPILWRAIVSDTQARSLPHWHRANMFEAFIEAISAAPAQRIPQRLFVFGISALPDNYLQALEHLGKRCDIHLMVANPCRQFWSDIVDKRYLGKLLRRHREGTSGTSDDAEIAQLQLYEQGNPLLASMGKLGRDYLYLINQHQLLEVELFSDDDNSSLLQSLQSDILSLRNRRAFEDRDDPQASEHGRLMVECQDRSISLHSCHSGMREVEVLQDQLLSILERHPEIEPRDIIVMMPDVSAYSPYIEAVFGQTPSDRYLPFSISDRNAQQESPLISNFLALLSLSMGRYTSTELLELMSLPALLRRFELDEANFELMRTWVLGSGIKWGLDASSREALDLPSFKQNSWQFGLDRMFAGFALGDIEKTWQGIAPYGEIEGLDAAILGQLAQFISLLNQCEEQLTRSANIEQWVSYFHQLLKDLYTPDDADLAAIEIIHHSLEKIQSTLLEVAYPAEVPAEIVIDYLQQSLTEQRSGQRFLSGRINFCTLMPMRAIPFKVVCLLGMNDSEYPRSVPAMGFDLMAQHSRKGDRSRRDDDRYLFLEALLSARSILYISYVGRSLADNSRKVPSVLISELFEYLQQGYYLADSEDDAEQNLSIIERQSAILMAHLTTEHPLTPYHRSYFESSATLFSYAQQWLPIAQVKLENKAQDSFSQALPETVIETLELTQLSAFFRQPIRYYLQHKLQVNFLSEDSVIEDEEPFVLSALDNYRVRDQLLQHALLERDVAGFSDYLSATGLLPLGVAGDKNLHKNLHDATELAQKVKPLISGVKRRLSFTLPIAGIELQGWIEPLYDVGVVKYSAGNSSGRSYIGCWVEHLAACANGVYQPSYFRAINEQFHFRAIETATAHAYLSDLIAIYKQGLRSPLAWLPDLGWKLFNADDAEKVMQNLQSNYNNFDDPYIQRVYPRWQDLEKGLQAINPDIFTPLSEHLTIDTEGEAS
ncbi:MAG: exodeoxyribonuclease V subunit gamma [Oceanospirillaceae bacterium]|nr:exodeoxyribonuclease V subunit gamma [Oceanospirillaceae bacterium]